ncbi:cytochrome P450 [Chaetomium tenue]|uniref:Cytochrome P450 n=1 Tax=Chaetomium tenue TaxID=1854479 RepID=A0ACB7NWM7_9PEZI|nr:cytochrome P450 [Chaetomium globosum]
MLPLPFYAGGSLGSPLVTAVAGTATILSVAVYLFYLWLRPKPVPGIPYNVEATKTIWGDLPAWNRYAAQNGELSSWLGELCLKHQSPVAQAFIHPFSKPWILVGDFHEAQDILMRRTDFEKPQFLIDGLAALGGFHARFKTNDPRFKASRQIRQDLMAPKFLHGYIGPFAHTKGLQIVELFKAKAELANGRPFRMQKDFARVVLDIMLHHAFGEEHEDSAMEPQLELITKMTPSSIPKGDKDEPVEFPDAPQSFFFELLHETAEVMERTTISPTPRLSHWWWSKHKWYKHMVEERHNVMGGLLRKAAANVRAGKAESALEHMMMRELALAEKQGREPQLVTRELSDEMFADPMTGHHTTSSAMTWLVKYLTGYQHTQHRLREELYATFPQAVQEERPPTFEELRQARLPYLDAVIEESRRLTPFVIVREAAQDLDILGHRVPKGSQCFMLSAGPGITLPSVPVDESKRSPSSKAGKRWGVWDESRDLKLFEPERWLVTREDGGYDFDATAGPQLGFGMGPRQCWGRRLAQLAVRTVIALVVWELEMLEIPEELGGYAGLDGISRQPIKAFARMRKITPYKVQAPGA